MPRRLWITLVTILTTGCGPVYLPVPPQQSEPHRQVRALLEMTGDRPPVAWGGIDSGVLTSFQPGADWRWAAEHSAFHVALDGSAGWSASARITAVRSVLEKVGPQKVIVRVNDVPVGSADLTQSKDYDLSFPVQPAALARTSPARLTLDVSPCLPQPGSPSFCVLLHSVGFTRDAR